MSVRLKDLDPAARKRVEQSAARGGSPSAAPTGSPRRKKPLGAPIFCHGCGAEMVGKTINAVETAMTKHLKAEGHHRFDVRLG